MRILNIIIALVGFFASALIIRIIYPLLATVVNLIPAGVNRAVAWVIIWLVMVFVFYFGMTDLLLTDDREVP